MLYTHNWLGFILGTTGLTGKTFQRERERGGDVVTASLENTPAPFCVILNYILPCLQQVCMANATMVKCNQM